MTATAVQSCWRQIGVFGDGSCVELPTVVHCRNCPRFAAAARSLLVRVQQAPLTAHEQAATGPVSRAGQAGVLVFRLAGMALGLDAEFAAELAADRRPRRIAHRSGRLLEGLVNIRGELHLCIALDRMLGLQRDPLLQDSGVPRLVVVRAGAADPWVFRADAVLGIERYGSADLSPAPPAPPAALAPFVRGMVSLASRSDAPVASGRRSQPADGAGWPSRLILLDGAALLAGLENAVY